MRTPEIGADREERNPQPLCIANDICAMWSCDRFRGFRLERLHGPGRLSAAGMATRPPSPGKREGSRLWWDENRYDGAN
jgi:hypothetical protein